MSKEEQLLQLTSRWCDKDCTIRAVNKISKLDYYNLLIELANDDTLKYLFAAIMIVESRLPLGITRSYEVEHFVDGFNSVQGLVDFFLFNTKD